MDLPLSQRFKHTYEKGKTQHEYQFTPHASSSWQASFTWAAARCDHLEYETTLGESYEINQEPTGKHKAIICFLQNYAFIFGYSLPGYLLET